MTISSANTFFFRKSLMSMAFTIASITSSYAQGAEHVFRKPTSNAAVFYVKNKFNLNSESELRNAAKKLKGSTYSYNNSKKIYVWDLKGGILDGRDQRGDGGQSETQEPLARVKMKLIIKNGFIRNNKDGIGFFNQDSGVEKITWLNVGEDAVATHKGAFNFSAIDCEAMNSSKGDKSFQFNESKGLIVRGNTIRGDIAKRNENWRHPHHKPFDRSYVSTNKFINIDTAHNLSSITVEELGPSTYQNVRLKYKHGAGSKVLTYKP